MLEESQLKLIAEGTARNFLIMRRLAEVALHLCGGLITGRRIAVLPPSDSKLQAILKMLPRSKHKFLDTSGT